MKIKNLVKNNTVSFEYYRAQHLYYKVIDPTDKEEYLFPVPIDDVGQASMEKTDKALLYMRWIRKAIENNELIQYRPYWER